MLPCVLCVVTAVDDNFQCVLRLKHDLICLLDNSYLHGLHKDAVVSLNDITKFQ